MKRSCLRTNCLSLVMSFRSWLCPLDYASVCAYMLPFFASMQVGSEHIAPCSVLPMGSQVQQWWWPITSRCGSCLESSGGLWKEWRQAHHPEWHVQENLIALWAVFHHFPQTNWNTYIWKFEKYNWVPSVESFRFITKQLSKWTYFKSSSLSSSLSAHTKKSPQCWNPGW